MPSAAQLKRHLTRTVVALACAGAIVVAGTSVAGIQGSGFRLQSVSFGRIAAIDDGTISVNEVEYATDGAAVHIDGRDGSPSDLRVGQIVTVRGSLDPDRQTGSAIDLSFIGDVRGEISGVDPAKNTFVVLGQTVRLVGDTEFGPGLSLEGIQGSGLRGTVEVSGFPTATGDLIASRVELASADAPLQVKGTVQMLDTTASTLRINALAVDFSGASIDGTLVEGVTATVEGGVLTDGMLRATRLWVASGVGAKPGEHGQFEGLITSFLSAADFRLGDQRIVTDADSRFVLQGQPLGLDVAVRVQGKFDASGALVASKVVAKQQSANAMVGLIESVDASQGTMTVLGVRVAIPAATTFSDRSKQHLKRMGFGDVRTGDTVEVRGTPDPARATFFASFVERQEPQAAAFVRGAARATPSGFSVLGVNIHTQMRTRFGKPAVQIAGQQVEVRGTLTGGVIVADEIRLLRPGAASR